MSNQEDCGCGATATDAVSRFLGFLSSSKAEPPVLAEGGDYSYGGPSGAPTDSYDDSDDESAGGSSGLSAGSPSGSSAGSPSGSLGGGDGSPGGSGGLVMTDYFVDAPAATGGDERGEKGAGGLPPKLAAPLKGLTTNTGECVGDGVVCSTPKVVRDIKQYVVSVGVAGSGGSGGGGGNDVDAAKKILACTTEACVVAHPHFKHFVAKKEGPKGVRRLELELAARFKPPGPRDTTKLLSNFDIDGVLQQWAASTFPRFYNFDFNMMDFERTKSSLARTNVADIVEGRVAQDLGAFGRVRRKCDVFACVLNTDVSTGGGKHWVAVLGDCRGKSPGTPWTVEYFNSAGNPPPAPVARWMERAAGELAGLAPGPVKTVALTSVRHQKSQSECGLYVLYYIRRRLEGAPYSDFARALIPDGAMTEFRKHVFRPR